MKAYIDKAALVAEIERLIDSHKPLKTLDPTYCEGLNDSLDNILSFLDTLEMKEVEEEPVSNDLEEAAYQFANCFENHFGLASMSFIKGAKWQKERILNNATEREVKVDVCGYPYIDFTELYDYDKDIPLAKEGDKVKLVIVKDWNG